MSLELFFDVGARRMKQMCDAIDDPRSTFYSFMEILEGSFACELRLFICETRCCCLRLFICKTRCCCLRLFIFQTRDKLKERKATLHISRM